MELFRLFGTIFLKDDDVDKKLDNMDKKAGGLGEKLGGMVGTAAKWGAGMAVAAGAAGAAVLGVVSAASDAASEFADMSVRTGITTDNLQKLKFAAEQAGVNFDVVTGSVGKLTKQMTAAADGNKTAMAAFDTLGVSVKNQDGSLRQMDGVYMDTLKSLAGMKNETERNALAMQLFGKAGLEMVPLLAQGEGGINELMTKAEELGLVMDESAIAAGDNFGDTLDQLTSSLGMVGTKIGVGLMPMVQGFVDFILANMPTIQLIMSTLFSVLGVGIDLLGQGINFLIANVFNPFKDTIIANQATILAAWEVLKTNTQLIFDAILLLAQTVFGLLKAFWQVWGGEVVNIFKIAFDLVVNTFKSASKIITGLMNILIGILTGDWGRAWQGMKDVVVGVWNTITGVVKAGINFILNGVNAIISAINAIKVDVPDWIPGIGGNSIGFNLPKIPMFAQGTDWFEGGYAIVGEEGPELVNLGRGSSVMPADETKNALGGLAIHIENFINNRAQDVENFAAELEFYRKQTATAKGGAY